MTNFDQSWVVYEESYVKELMTIEQEARRYITDAIELENALFELEKKTKEEDNLISKVLNCFIESKLFKEIMSKFPKWEKDAEPIFVN